jgi:hypothetical protein
MSEIILDILKILLPAIVIVFLAYMIIKSFLDKEINLKKLEVRASQQNSMIPLRLQSYERIALFLERSDFNNLIPRIRKSDMTAKDLQYAMLANIRMEYEHNLAQQIYISNQLWRMVVLCKDQIIKIINLVSATLPPESMGNELSRAIFQFVIENEEPMPTQPVMEYLKQEVRTLF